MRRNQNGAILRRRSISRRYIHGNLLCIPESSTKPFWFSIGVALTVFVLSQLGIGVALTSRLLLWFSIVVALTS